MTDEGKGYSEEYYDFYHSGGESVNYFESPEIIAMQEKFAAGIIGLLHPGKTLDVGCACGHLVSALRDSGVEAYGTDASAYAIEHVRPEYRKFCCRSALPDIVLPDSFPKKYDLVTCIEVIEHINGTDNEKAISSLTALSDTVLFSSTPDDFDEPTHINVHPISFWCGEFAKFGFYPDTDTDLSFGPPQFLLFRRGPTPEHSAFFHYLDILYRERKLWMGLAQERLEKYQENLKLAQERLTVANERLNLYREACDRINSLEKDLNDLQSSFAYRMAQKFSRAFHRCFPDGTRRRRAIKALFKPFFSPKN